MAAGISARLVGDALLPDGRRAVPVFQLVAERYLDPRYAPEAVSTRMYRSFGAMLEGWSKNLALLFGNPLALAAWRILDLVLLIGLPLLAWFFYQQNAQLVIIGALLLLWLRNLWRYYRRVAKSNFPFADCLISPPALPLFAMLLYRSWFVHTVTKRVSWKGRDFVSHNR